jgi:hypothetical protein
MKQMHKIGLFVASMNNVWCENQTSKDIHHKVMEESIEVQNIVDSPKGKKKHQRIASISFSTARNVTKKDEKDKKYMA